jgi:transcriptional regulator with XRE-family HTH domain
MIPKAIIAALAERCRLPRLSRNESQAALAKRAGIGIATLQRFELTGRINTLGLARIVYALERDQEFVHLLTAPPAGSGTGVDELEAFSAAKLRQRARRPKSDAR